MKKRFYLGTNWKMHLTNGDARRYMSEWLPLVKARGSPGCTLFVIPSFLALQWVRDAIAAAGVEVKLGAQNVHWESADEATGEISVRMLQDVPVDLVEIGHSERRRKFGETDEIVNRKVRAVLEGGLTALLCLGETGEEQRRDRGAAMLRRQIFEGLREVTPAQAEKLMIAYEPVWAIGPGGEAAEAGYVAERHAWIRARLRERFGPGRGEGIPLLYGGSVNHGNFASYARLDEVDGLFVGRTAWEAVSFAKLIGSLESLGLVEG